MRDRDRPDPYPLDWTAHEDRAMAAYRGESPHDRPDETEEQTETRLRPPCCWNASVGLVGLHTLDCPHHDPATCPTCLGNALTLTLEDTPV